jgi:predicted DNA-binding transcriptional regulator AlpA
LPTESNPVTEEERETIVDMYKRGIKLVEITRVTGRSRPTIYSVLQKRGVHPTRQHRPATGKLTVNEMLDRYRDCIAEKTRLELECERQHLELEQLRAALARARRK